eukprot:15309487-Ditylum_brightwellii.AAC.1
MFALSLQVENVKSELQRLERKAKRWCPNYDCANQYWMEHNAKELEMNEVQRQIKDVTTKIATAKSEDASSHAKNVLSFMSNTSSAK